MQSLNRGLRIADFRGAQPRRGMSIIEVLFAILITTVGLFGAIALFPVASSQARRARTNDAAAAAGRQAIHTFDTLGMRRFDRWYTWSNDRSHLTRLSLLPGGIGAVDGKQSYCIDPRFIVQHRQTGSGQFFNSSPAAYFPYNSGLNGNGGVNSSSLPPRMHRIGFFGPAAFARNGQPAITVSGNKLLADSIFQLEDDLAFGRPGIDETLYVNGNKVKSDRSLPAVQLFDTFTNSSGTFPIKRQTQGHLSWIATLVPKVELYSGSGSDEFVLSVVVFYDRPTDMAIDDSERVVNFRFEDDGSTGGEVLLYTSAAGQTQADQEAATARLKLRPNNWVLLACNVTLGSNTINRFQWYRVTDADDTVEYTAAGGGLPNRYEMYATLIGPDWSWGGTISSQQATIVSNVIAVFEKTIRLDYGN